MQEWGLPPRAWYAEPRADRAYMRAQSRVSALLSKMLQHDTNEEVKRKADIERKRRGKK